MLMDLGSKIVQAKPWKTEAVSSKSGGPEAYSSKSSKPELIAFGAQGRGILLREYCSGLSVNTPQL